MEEPFHCFGELSDPDFHYLIFYYLNYLTKKSGNRNTSPGCWGRLPRVVAFVGDRHWELLRTLLSLTGTCTFVAPDANAWLMPCPSVRTRRRDRRTFHYQWRLTTTNGR